MRRFVRIAAVVCVAAFSLTGEAWAQAVAEDFPISLQASGGVAFGEKSSGTYAIEANYAVGPMLTIFVEGGQVAHAAPTFVSDRAAIVAGAIGGSADVKEKTTFGDAGFKIFLAPDAVLAPYVGVGLGLARVQNNTAFSVNGAGVSDATLLSQYGVQLGADLAGSVDKTALTFMAGIARAIGERCGLDVSYRYGRLFPKTSTIADDQAINIQRLQLGFLVRF